MAPAILNYFGFGGSAPVTEKKNAVRALPGSWYTSPEMYELERRAIFSRKWLMITHKSRFNQAGDWLKYSVAGYEFVLCRDREGKINGFHNVCRHRAYPVVTEEKGTAKIFACRYHGWSYGLTGKLAKAPGYQDLDGFDKSKNSLFPIHVRLDVNGFVWINLDAKRTPEVAWEDDFDTVDKQKRYESYNFENYDFDHVWGIDAQYNWKIASDNYNECYHCANTHPDLPEVANLESYDVKTRAYYIQHDAATTPEQMAAGLNVAATYVLPNASTNVSPHFFFIQRFEPTSPTTTAVRYEVYRNRYSTEEQFQKINQMYKRVMTEDKELCLFAQRNLNAGIFVNGEMHPKMEKGPLYFQKMVRETVVDHHKREQAAGREIWPARQSLPIDAEISEKDVEFCSGLACQTNQEGLAW